MKQLLFFFLAFITLTAAAQDFPLTGADSLIRITIVARKNPIPQAVHDTVTIHDTVYVAVPPATNKLPAANAGADKSIQLPANTVTVTGTGTDTDGTVIGYAWTKISGPSAFTVSGNNSASLVLSNLVQGVYTFRLIVTDNSGGSSKGDDVNITVSAAATTPGNYGTLIYSNNFNAKADINTNQLGSGSISTDVKSEGAGSFKSVVNAGAGQISGGYRSEQQYAESYSPTGADITVEYNEMFETQPNVAGLSVQWHGNASGTSGQMSMWTQGGKFMVQRNTIGTAGSSNIYQSGSLMNIELNRWYKIRWEIRFSPGSDGYVRCYIDNNLYYSVSGKTSDGTGQYLKVGQNLFASPGNNSILYIDELKIWKK